MLLLKNLLGNAMPSVGLPLRQKTFRRIWVSSLFSNLGQQFLAVAAAWTMLDMTHSPVWVASVQSALMLPVMILAVPAGAIADMYDRRKVAIAALTLALSGAMLLAILAATGLVTPIVILMCCLIVGSGVALYSPAWQSSASEVVGGEALPAAVALYSLSNNTARSVGPAIAGIIVGSVGIVAAFAANALLYLPILAALYAWKRVADSPRLPPERLDRAMVGGLRYVRYSPPIRRVLVRTFMTSVGGASLYAMMPLVARMLLNGGADTYGILLGAFGVGAVLSAVNTGAIRRRFSNEQTALIGAICMGSALLIMAVSRIPIITAFGTLVAGFGWISQMSLFNVSVQLSVPRWVGGRALSTFQASCAAGIAGGAWMWGNIAQGIGLEFTLFAAFGWLMFAALLGRWVPLPGNREEFISTQSPSSEPVVELDITGRSGPIIIEIEHNVPPESAREFYHLAIQVQRSRERDGAFGVTIARDIENPVIWIERFHFPTWNDYLRWRDRPTVEDRKLRDQLAALRIDQKPPRIRRMLERPFGSVRWRDEAPDYGRRSGNSGDFIV